MQPFFPTEQLYVPCVICFLLIFFDLISSFAAQISVISWKIVDYIGFGLPVLACLAATAQVRTSRHRSNQYVQQGRCWSIGLTRSRQPC